MGFIPAANDHPAHSRELRANGLQPSEMVSVQATGTVDDSDLNDV